MIPPHDDESLRALLASARAGDRSAMAGLLETYRSYLLAVAGRSLEPALQANLAPSDLVQETMLKADLRFGDFTGHSPAELAHWMRRILLNHLIDQLRRQRLRYRSQLSLDAVPGNVGQVKEFVDPHPTPAGYTARQELAARLTESIAHLPPAYQDVIQYRHQESLEFAEIGRKMGRTANSAQKLLVRALVALREIHPKWGL